MDFALFYPRYTAERSCFAKRLPKMISDSPENPLRQHSYSWSCNNHSHSRAKCYVLSVPMCRDLRTSARTRGSTMAICGTPHGDDVCL
jgi:hypothetical protein